ncbi:putative UDP-glucose flavonoid 3-O-glucosyltransferase 3 [Vitis vinifera]|uniref:putative UDP-glucose flavonoid 3-O-glucosyltransferase 3 n=1 Tax=Vitis vinifera TaxID=29760 RepID=UPI002882FD06|nr:putative UDP-glucose flavonoid 3-O-glucosyltransferase 3 [Vitis vinifera]
MGWLIQEEQDFLTEKRVAARARIEQAGGECLTSDQLALKAPLDQNMVLLRDCSLVMKKVEFVFIPLPLIGHLVPTVELAKLLVDRDDRFSITLLIMKLPIGNSVVTNFLHSVSASVSGSIRFVHLPEPGSDSSNSDPSSSSRGPFVHNLIENQKPLVRDAVHQLVQSGESGRLGGIVVDLTCTSMIDVANELGVPSYVFFTCSAALLALIFHLQTLKDHQGVDVTEFGDSDIELVVPGFVNSVPARVLPAAAVDKEGGGSTVFLDRPRRFRETKGILVNTFIELESHAINSFGNGTTPPVYPVGPLLNLKHDQNRELDVIHWLDDQPPSSVVFLCFGSLGAFNKGQIMEIANGLENSGFRFVWTLRGPPPKDDIASSDYTDFDEVLPKGFLNRTFGVGKIIGWAPQTDILSHHAIGGFISHCGWNSILESICDRVSLRSPHSLPEPPRTTSSPSDLYHAGNPFRRIFPATSFLGTDHIFRTAGG